MSLVRIASFLIVKTVVSGKKSVMSTNHCARTTSCLKRDYLEFDFFKNKWRITCLTAGFYFTGLKCGAVVILNNM